MSDLLEGKRILIVDDEPDVLESLAELLDQCNVDTAPNYDAAVRFLEKKTYDAAILDIMGVDGYRILEATAKKQIPTIMFTAHALAPEYLVKSIKLGAHSYVPKDKMAEIDRYLVDILDRGPRDERRSRKWLDWLKPYFDQKFGANWQDEQKQFWDEYERSHPISRKEVEDIL
jgi:DNA-binding NtrC family response regulator